MYTLIEVKKYFESQGFDKKTYTPERIAELYKMISDAIPRVNDLDKKWVACSEDYEKDTAHIAIKEIISEYDSTIDIHAIQFAMEHACNVFKEKDLQMKHRIPFYIVMMDILIS
jgi:hypothetical protein